MAADGDAARSPIRSRSSLLLAKAPIDCTAAAQAGELIYTHRDVEAVGMVDRGESEAAFLMQPPTMAEVEAVCLAGHTMPEKSTYFYPKLLSGLVLHALDDPPRFVGPGK